MSKSRLCEYLNVEPDEDIVVEGYEGITFSISEDGGFQASPSDICDKTLELLCAVIAAVECPEKIIHKPKWTKRDVEDAKAIKRLMPWCRQVERDKFGGMYIASGNEGFPIEASLFPNLKQNEKIDLDEILKSGEAKE